MGPEKQKRAFRDIDIQKSNNIGLHFCQMQKCMTFMTLFYEDRLYSDFLPANHFLKTTKCDLFSESLFYFIVVLI